MKKTEVRSNKEMYKQCNFGEYQCFTLDEAKRAKNNIHMRRSTVNDFILGEYDFNRVHRVN